MRKRSRFDAGPIRDPSSANLGNNSALVSLNQQLFSSSNALPGHQHPQQVQAVPGVGGMGMPPAGQPYTHNIATTATIPQQHISSGSLGLPAMPGIPGGLSTTTTSVNPMNSTVSQVPTITIKMSDTLSALQHQASTKDSRELFVGNLNNVNNEKSQ